MSAGYATLSGAGGSGIGASANATELQMRFLVAGESSVGKSSIVNRLLTGAFGSEEHQITVGVEAKPIWKHILADSDAGMGAVSSNSDVTCRVQIWDVGG